MEKIMVSIEAKDFATLHSAAYIKDVYFNNLRQIKEALGSNKIAEVTLAEIVKLVEHI